MRALGPSTSLSTIATSTQPVLAQGNIQDALGTSLSTFSASPQLPRFDPSKMRIVRRPVGQPPSKPTIAPNILASAPVGPISNASGHEIQPVAQQLQPTLRSQTFHSLPEQLRPEIQHSQRTLTYPAPITAPRPSSVKRLEEPHKAGPLSPGKQPSSPEMRHPGHKSPIGLPVTRACFLSLAWHTDQSKK